LTDADARRELRVGARELRVVALVFVVGRQGEVVPLFQRDFRRAVCEESGAYLRPLGVEEDGCAVRF
jgi:hypothetical protein